MTDIEMKLSKFNQEYSGRRIKHCTFLGSTLNCDYEKLAFCCNFTTEEMPKICDAASVTCESLKDIFIDRLIDTIHSNQTEGPCTGCKHLQEMEFGGFDHKTMQLSSIVWNNFRRCNSSCVYCFQDQTERTAPYLAYQLAEHLFVQGFVAENAQVFFGGGEPSMLQDLKDYLEFGYRHHLDQLINTSAIQYSQEIYDGLAKGLRVQISLDSGTRETYQKIKRRDRFEAVWNTIGRYCDFPEAVNVKYILFSWNSAREDLDGFVERCKEHGVKNVEISGERNVALANASGVFESENRELCWTFGEREEQACIYLIDKCLQNGFAVCFSTNNFSKHLEKHILEGFAQLFKARMEKVNMADKVYIFGMGHNGKRLYDCLSECGISFKGFLTSAAAKHTDGYRGMTCYRTVDIPKDAHIILSNTKYVPILKQLREEGFQNIDVFRV